MKKGFWFFSTLLGLALLISACGAQGAAVVTQPTATIESAAQPTAASSGAMVALAQNDTFGPILVDDKGMSLYLFTKDTPNVTVCYDQCATNWPPLLTAGDPVAGEGVDASKLGTTPRTDGTIQVTYNGWPLYYYIKDMKAGDVTGQEVGDVWFLLTPAGEMITASAGGGAMVAIAQNDMLGSFLVDEKGMSLYLFTKDTPNVTVCYDQCATNWPPLLTTGAPVAGEGVNADLLGTTERTDGTSQVTYNGWPLYYYIKDAKAGDVTGQLVGDVWFVLTPGGEMITASTATGAMVAVSQNDTLGSFLVDDKGMTLYLFTKDTPNVTVCYDQCATNWPPLLTTGDPVAGEGVDASKFGTTERTDGTLQVTYNGWPLYYYITDAKAGDVTGQEVGDVWYVVSPAGEKVEASSSGSDTGAEVKVATSDALGSFLVDDEGLTLYIFTNDTPNVSNCYDQCATNWPPLLTTGEPRASEGVDDSMIGTTERTDGTIQVTYNGWPLYYYIKDTKAGDTTGQAVGDVWYVLSPAGEMIGAL
jgi:predicted lipoprotein with Yx(FWY)xxD motif